MQEYLKQLNKEQYEAATTTEGPLLVLAGAGSGKTNAMTHRIAYLIKDCNVNPYSLLAVTFTNKAAKEMQERVEALVGEYPFMWIQTFHSACLRILRSHADRIGYSKNFVVYDPVDQKALIKSLVKELNYDEKIFTPSYVLSVISDNKENEIDPETFKVNIARAFGVNKELQEGLGVLYEMYQDRLIKNNAMDFDDLLLNTVSLFSQCRDVLSLYQEKFKYIMVDEYQDTNHIQYKFVSMLAAKSRNICVVGDDDQCIYEWRGASIRNILEFDRDFPDAKVIKLEQNYRSTGNILNAANSVIAHNKHRKKKALWTAGEDGEKPEYHRLESDQEEARYVAGRIKVLMKNNPDLCYKDFAILYRTNVQSRRFEDCFAAMDLPYQVLSGLRYFDRKEIKDAVSYLRLVANPKDDLSLERIINEPKRGIGPGSLEKIKAFAKVKDISLLEALADSDILDALSKKASDAAFELYNLINSLSVSKDELSVGDVYDTILDKSGYLEALEKDHSVESDSRKENLLEFKSVIAEKEKELGEGTKLTLDNFMESLALVSDVDNHDPNMDAVTMMTLHSAKGLEFSIVFIPGLEMGLFPSYRSMEENPDIEEERRLFYVGITRAKKRLYLTSAEQRMIYGRTEYTRESSLLKEIDRKYLTGDALYDKKSSYYSYNRYDKEAPITTSYVSPIASSAAIRENVSSIAKKATLAGADIKPGDMVKHEKFGTGTVISLDGRIITVCFKSEGTKKMAIDVAPLEKV